VRLFEAAACGCPILSDPWPGLETLFEPGLELEVVETPEAVLRLLREHDSAHRQGLAAAARRRVLAAHTAERRAAELEGVIESVGGTAFDDGLRRSLRADDGLRPAVA
jgi:spore maturation protein CgeB